VISKGNGVDGSRTVDGITNGRWRRSFVNTPQRNTPTEPTHTLEQDETHTIYLLGCHQR